MGSLFKEEDHIKKAAREIYNPSTVLNRDDMIAELSEKVLNIEKEIEKLKSSQTAQIISASLAARRL